MDKINKILKQLDNEGCFDDNRIYWKNGESSSELFKELLIKLEMDVLPEYISVAKWMSENKGYGLMMIGNAGRGKTLIAQKILPVFFRVFLGKEVKYYSSSEINDNFDQIIKKRIVILDDIGLEDQSVVYGERKWVFPIIMDNAEKNGNIIVVTTNLTPDMFEEKYGTRTRERIKACCATVIFNGKSLRKGYDQ